MLTRGNYWNEPLLILAFHCTWLQFTFTLQKLANGTSGASLACSLQLLFILSILTGLAMLSHKNVLYTFTRVLLTFTLQKWACWTEWSWPWPCCTCCTNHAGQLTSITVYTVKQTGLTHAGPQKCASVNVVLVYQYYAYFCGPAQLALTVYTVMVLCFYSLPLYDGGQDHKIVTCFAIDRYRLLLQMLFWNYELLHYKTILGLS